MIQSAEKYLVSDLFGIDKDVKYIIPPYQREYVWNKQNLEKLFDDILQNEKGHFLGSIICVNNNRDALAISELELIDGQQRFTTISLLYCAIYNVLKFKFESEDEEIKNELFNLKYRIIQKNNKKQLKVEPSLQRSNFQDYLQILGELEILSQNEKTSNVGNRRLYRSYTYFCKRLLETDVNGDGVFSVDDVTFFLSKLNSYLIVKIEVNTHSDAFTLFETINNTGLKLSAIDLIKNNMLAQVVRLELTNIEDAFGKWKYLIENLPDDPSYQERFLRHFYNAFKYKSTYKIERVSRATASNLIGIYEKLINRDVKTIFDDLEEKSKVYGNLITFDNVNHFDEGVTSKLVDLYNIGATPSYSFLLYFFGEKQVDQQLQLDVLDLLVKYFVRRNLTDTPPTRDLDKIFIDLISHCEQNQDRLDSQLIKTFLIDKNRFASSESFRNKLEGDIYEDNYNLARFVLCKIEELNNKTSEMYTDLWSRNKNGIYIWTIEHILPQGINLPDTWTKEIANSDQENASLLQNEYVHKIGNLTLSGYNQKLSNLSFIVKRDRRDKQGNYVGYKNGLYLNKDISRMDSWSIDKIKERTEELVKIALDTFSI